MRSYDSQIEEGDSPTRLLPGIGFERTTLYLDGRVQGRVCSTEKVFPEPNHSVIFFFCLIDFLGVCVDVLVRFSSCRVVTELDQSTTDFDADGDYGAA